MLPNMQHDFLYQDLKSQVGCIGGMPQVLQPTLRYYNSSLFDQVLIYGLLNEYIREQMLKGNFHHF